MQIYQQERIEVDNKIDDYFESALGLCEQTSQIDSEKYKAWLVLFGKSDNQTNRREFESFVNNL